jgi:hypothetical protein
MRGESPRLCGLKTQPFQAQSGQGQRRFFRSLFCSGLKTNNIFKVAADLKKRLDSYPQRNDTLTRGKTPPNFLATVSPLILRFDDSAPCASARGAFFAAQMMQGNISAIYLSFNTQSWVSLIKIFRISFKRY